MAFLLRLRTQILSWSNDAPLPNLPDATPSFQSWHAFDTSNNRWSAAGLVSYARGTAHPNRGLPGLVLVSWNVDCSSDEPEARMTAILRHIRHLDTPADLIFFQEVSRPALATILQDQWIREG